MQPTDPTPTPDGHADGVLEALWSDRGRKIVGHEFRLELLITAVFLLLGAGLLLLAPLERGPHWAVVPVLLAYVLAARTEFAVGSGHVVPTQLFLVSLFVLAPAPLVPFFVFLGLSLSVAGGAAFGRDRLERLVYSGGDAAHALGPALVISVFAGGEVSTATIGILVLAFAAQLAFDSASSFLHDLLVFGIRPKMHARVLAQVWGVDAALTPIGALAGVAAQGHPLEALLPLPLVALLFAMAKDRGRRIEHAQERLEALQHERARLQVAVRRIGDAFASNLDLEGLLDIVTHTAVEALNGASGRASACAGPGRSFIRRSTVEGPMSGEAALAEAEVRAVGARALVVVERDGIHGLGCPVGGGDEPEAVVALVRDTPFSEEEQALLSYLCEQASVAAANVTRHELLHKQALTDGLTGLANHRRLQEVLVDACARFERGGVPAGLVLLDLDNFKLVNDHHGHVAGDTVLAAVAQRIKASCRVDDEPARYGGEELAVVVPGLDATELEEFAERLRRSVAELELTSEDGRRLTATASFGVARLGDDVRRPSQLIDAADRALYEAKRGGKNRVVVSDGLAMQRPDGLVEQSELLAAIEREQFVLHYQPKVRIATGEVEGVEALLRWQHPIHGLLAPDAFLALAERAGLMRPLTQLVLDIALNQAREWRAEGLILPVAVNVSASSLSDMTLLRDVSTALEYHGLPASALTIELTESTLMTDPDLAEIVLRDLRELGVAIAVDDYGTGYSSLAYLRRFRVDELKLDRSFVHQFDEDADSGAIVRSTIELAHSLGVRIVVEGVESIQAWDALERLGCDVAQGYLLTRPLEATRFVAWLEHRDLRGEPVAAA